MKDAAVEYALKVEVANGRNQYLRIDEDEIDEALDEAIAALNTKDNATKFVRIRNAVIDATNVVAVTAVERQAGKKAKGDQDG